MKYYNYISGGMTPAHLLAAMSIAFLGWFVYKTISGASRDRTSQRSPGNFSLSFWFKDNWQEAVKHIIIMFALVRFASEVVAQTVPNASQWISSNDPMWIYFAVGILKAHILAVLKKRRERVK